MTPEGALHAPPASRAGTGGSRFAVLKREAAAFYRAMLAPGSGRIRRICDITANTGESVYFVGDRFAAGPSISALPGLFRLDLGAEPRLLRDGPAALPRLSPDGNLIALVTSAPEGDAVLLLNPADGATLGVHAFSGRVENLAWSPDGVRLLVQLAGLGADQSGRDGGVMRHAEGAIDVPVVSPSDAADLWRRLWVLEPDGRRLCVSGARETIWEAAWCGADALVVVRSSDHSENAWYDAELAHIDHAGGETRTLYRSKDQIGLPAASADGARIAFVEAVCSDRGLVCGDLLAIDFPGGEVRRIDTNGVDVSSIAFRTDGMLHYAGLRSLETVIGDVDLDGGGLAGHWSSDTETCGVWHPGSLPIGSGHALIVREGPGCPPELALVSAHRVTPLLSTAEDARSKADEIDVRKVSWAAADGTALEGLLIAPKGPGPFPVLMEVHGGPVLAHRPRWIGHLRTAWLTGLGYAVFHPNPRGSCGRGRVFAAAVRGDMGGADAGDLMAGLDALVAQGLAGPDRLAVTGSSYGGFMAAWLVTQTDRFAASIAISPITNWRSQHGTSQIGRFDALFLRDPAEPDERSPVVFAERVTTPTLLLAGGLDRNTPAGQAQEFHTALLDRGVPSELAIYPQGGHSLRDLSITIDTSARTALWLERYLGS